MEADTSSPSTTQSIIKELKEPSIVPHASNPSGEEAEAELPQ